MGVDVELGAGRRNLPMTCLKNLWFFIRLRSSALQTALKILIGIGIIIYLAYTFDFKAVLATLSSVNLFFICLAVIVYSLTVLVLVLRWRLIVSRLGADIPVKTAYQAFMGSFLLSDISPARVGDLSRPLMVRDYIDVDRGFVSLVLDRYTDILSMLFLSICGFLLLYSSRIIVGSTAIILALSLLVLVSLVLATSLLLWIRRERMIGFLVRLIDRIESRHSFRGIEYVRSFLLGFDEGVLAIERPHRLLGFCFAVTVSAWVMHTLRVTLVLHAAGSGAPFIFLLCLLPIVSTLALVPVSPGGLGFVEGGYVAVMLLLGVPAPIGLSVALIDRAMSITFHVVAGFGGIRRL